MSAVLGIDAHVKNDLNYFAIGSPDSQDVHYIEGESRRVTPIGGFWNGVRQYATAGAALFATLAPNAALAQSAQNPIIYNGGVVNGANYSQKNAVGAWASVFGSGLSGVPGSKCQAPSLPLPRELCNTKVYVGGIQAPLNYVSDGQINLQIPFEAEGQKSVVVEANGKQSNAVIANVQSAAPAFFTLDASGRGYAAVQHADYTLVTANNPAKPGEIIVFYANGLGRGSPSIATGEASPDTPSTAAVPQLSIGGMPARILFSGYTPRFVALGQINGEIPAGLVNGDYAMIIGDQTTAIIPVRYPGSLRADLDIRGRWIDAESKGAGQTDCTQAFQNRSVRVTHSGKSYTAKTDGTCAYAFKIPGSDIVGVNFTVSVDPDPDGTVNGIYGRDHPFIIQPYDTLADLGDLESIQRYQELAATCGGNVPPENRDLLLEVRRMTASDGSAIINGKPFTLVTRWPDEDQPVGNYTVAPVPTSPDFSAITDAMIARINAVIPGAEKRVYSQADAKILIYFIDVGIDQTIQYWKLDNKGNPLYPLKAEIFLRKDTLTDPRQNLINEEHEDRHTWYATSRHSLCPNSAMYGMPYGPLNPDKEFLTLDNKELRVVKGLKNGTDFVEFVYSR